MNVYALTPTGNRPEGLALLGEYINAQTFKGPLTWVVVDDCDPATPLPKLRNGFHLEHIRPNWRWRPGQNTQSKSLKAGLYKIPAEAVLFILEDDDIYLPAYIETMLEAIAVYELIGEHDSRYYNVATAKFRVLTGHFHSSLCSTVCRGNALKTFRQLCATGMQKMIDVTLWKTFQGPKKLLSDHNVIGIKGLPGRSGIGIGHKRNFGSVDINDTLHKWAGNYADNYKIFRSVA